MSDDGFESYWGRLKRRRLSGGPGVDVSWVGSGCLLGVGEILGAKAAPAQMWGTDRSTYDAS